MRPLESNNPKIHKLFTYPKWGVPLSPNMRTSNENSWVSLEVIKAKADPYKNHPSLQKKQPTGKGE